MMSQPIRFLGLKWLNVSHIFTLVLLKQCYTPKIICLGCLSVLISIKVREVVWDGVSLAVTTSRLAQYDVWCMHNNKSRICLLGGVGGQAQFVFGLGCDNNHTIWSTISKVNLISALNYDSSTIWVQILPFIVLRLL